jgi:hypothetical protein
MAEKIESGPSKMYAMESLPLHTPTGVHRAMSVARGMVVGCLLNNRPKGHKPLERAQKVCECVEGAPAYFDR